MNALVTGANGHVGSQVVRAVRAAGWTPIAFVRAGSDRRALAGLDVETRTGDLLDGDSARRARAPRRRLELRARYFAGAGSALGGASCASSTGTLCLISVYVSVDASPPPWFALTTNGSLTPSTAR